MKIHAKLKDVSMEGDIIMSENDSSQPNTEINVQSLRKSIHLHQLTMAGALISVPIFVSLANSLNLTHGTTSAIVLTLIGGAFWVYQRQQELHKKITEISYQLKIGSRLYRKPTAKEVPEIYYIFQEGHRYYYLENQKNGEKRLVSKARILNDFDLSP